MAGKRPQKIALGTEGRVAPPVVTVVMPVRNEAGYIRQAIEAVLFNDFDQERLQILVVDGRSHDGTREIAAQLAARHPNLRLLDNPDLTVPHALNRALGQATGDVIIRIDGHAIVAPDFVRSSLEELEEHPECGCVGGAIESISSSLASEAISLAMSSPFGVGTARFRTGKQEGYVDTLAFGAYRREVFEKVGTFDEQLTRNQDDEFNFRLTQAGFRIWLSPKIRSKYFVRSNFAKLFRQYYQYGFWKVFVNCKHGRVTNLRQLAPASFLVLTALLLVSMPFSPPAGTALGLLVAGYVGAGVFFSLCRSRRPAVLLRALCAFGLIHTGYGLGYLEGIVRFLLLGLKPRASHAALSR
jgi:succinoglycan biosynthesis protein ExoA